MLVLFRASGAGEIQNRLTRDDAARRARLIPLVLTKRDVFV